MAGLVDLAATKKVAPRSVVLRPSRSRLSRVCAKFHSMYNAFPPIATGGATRRCKSLAVAQARRTPSPRGGEGWGEGVRKFQKILQHPIPLTLARDARSTSPLRGEVKRVSSFGNVA